MGMVSVDFVSTLTIGFLATSKFNGMGGGGTMLKGPVEITVVVVVSHNTFC